MIVKFEGFNYREKFDEKVSPKFMISSLVRFSINNLFIVCPSIDVLVRTPCIRYVTLAKKKILMKNYIFLSNKDAF